MQTSTVAHSMSTGPPPCPSTTETPSERKNARSIIACVSGDCQIFFSKDWQSDGIKGTDRNKVDRALRCRAESIARDEEKRVKAEADQAPGRLPIRPTAHT